MPEIDFGGKFKREAGRHVVADMRDLPEQVQEPEEGAAAPGEAGEEEGERQGTKET